MDHTAIARLFNRFEQADKSTTRKYGGSGLGMSISYNLAQLMNGEITVESEPNSGSKFTLILPLVKSNQQHLIDTQYQNLIPDFSNVRVLFAEDNAVNQLVIKAMLDKTHCKITLVANGIEALDAVNKQNFDLILLDIQMPEMDGLEACKQMRELRIETPIIALTANVMEHDIKSYLEKGFNAHISKPVEAQYLYKICASFINQS
jgi:CheY-like chemotaxis protein